MHNRFLLSSLSMEQEDTIDYNIRKTWYNITKMYNETATEHMASAGLGMILLNIDMYEGTPSTQLGPRMGMESTSLSRALKKLEILGVIERKTDVKDKRKSIIQLTKKGRYSREIAKKTVIEFNEKVRSHFTEDEMNSFLSMLNKINKIINL